MNKVTKIFRFSWLILCLVVVAVTGCGRHQNGETIVESSPEKEKLRVVTTLFPYYDFVRQVAGDRVDLTMVVPAGMDSHSFEPTPEDMKIIQSADVLICNGGAMEHWLTEVLEAIDTSNMTIVTGMDYVDTVEEEIVEGMEDDHDHDHHSHSHEHEADHAEEHSHEDEHAHEEEHSHEEDHAHEEEHTHEANHTHEDDGHGIEIEYDEHIWTSPVNCMTIVQVIGDTLAKTDSENSSVYGANTEAYLSKLQDLDKEFREVTAREKRNTIVIGDKFPFRYLADEYGLDYRAAFSGCSTDTEPSAKTIAYLIDKVRTEGIPVIYYLELSSHRVSEIIAEETGAVPLLLHSCHNVTRQEFDGGVTYLQLMEQNVINLRKGLTE